MVSAFIPDKRVGRTVERKKGNEEKEKEREKGEISRGMGGTR